MSFTRHVGKHGDRKVAVVFREVPGEAHMCLVTYTETLNQHVHDPLIKCIESDIGQNSEHLADALNRTYAKDGRPILQVLHLEGQLKKVQTSQIVMTPSPNQNIRLDELNKILDEMQQGESAVKRLQELDDSRGLQDPADVVRRMRGNQNPPAGIQASGDALGDSALANNLRQQAAKMDAEAKGLMAEAQRLMKEAAQMEGIVPETKPTKPTNLAAEAPKAKRAYNKKAKVSA
jgi:hypothetical protein